MEHIRGIGKLKAFSESLSIHEFRILHRFTLEHEGRYAAIHCRLATNQFDPPLAMDLRFDRISGLKIDGWGGSQSSIQGFAVIDISAKGWEGVAWEVIDYEEGLVHWYAEDWQILDVMRV